jgi:hypothetical protein
LSRGSANGLFWSEEMRRTDAVLDVNVIAARALTLGRTVTVERIEGALHDVFLSPAAVRGDAYARLSRWLRAYGDLAVGTPTPGCRAGSVRTATWQTSKRGPNNPDRLFLARATAPGLILQPGGPRPPRRRNGGPAGRTLPQRPTASGGRRRATGCP